MGQIFYPHAGCVYATKDTGTPGVISIPGLPTASGGTAILLRSFDMGDKDMVAPVATLDRKKILYTFGEDFGDFSASVWVLLGGGTDSTPLSKVIRWFKEQRVSKQNATLKISAGNQAYNCALTGMRVSEAMPDFNIQPVQLSGVIIDPSS